MFIHHASQGSTILLFYIDNIIITSDALDTIKSIETYLHK